MARLVLFSISMNDLHKVMEGTFSQLTGDSTLGREQQMCQRSDTGLPFRKTLIKWRNEEMGIQLRSTRMNAKSCPWGGRHSTAFVAILGREKAAG